MRWSCRGVLSSSPTCRFYLVHDDLWSFIGAGLFPPLQAGRRVSCRCALAFVICNLAPPLRGAVISHLFLIELRCTDRRSLRRVVVACRIADLDIGDVARNRCWRLWLRPGLVMAPLSRAVAPSVNRRSAVRLLLATLRETYRADRHCPRALPRSARYSLLSVESGLGPAWLCWPVKSAVCSVDRHHCPHF